MKLKKFNPEVFAVNNIVPIIFFILCFGGVIASGLSLTFILNELVTRLGRNLFIVISLIIPVVAGMGLNFALVIGAMVAQVGIIVIKVFDIGGLLGVIITMIISTPLAIIFGILTGKVLNKTRGKEMITGLILGFFANGIYQLVFLVFVGTIIPVKNPEIILSSGVGIKNAVDLKFIQYSLDRFVENVIRNTLLSHTGIKYEVQVAIGGVTIPVLTLLLCVALAFFIKYIMKD
jgi:simple sugar transport system permease protein